MPLAIGQGVANPKSLLSSAPVRQPVRPAQDEWGIFDPEQAGFEAVLRKLNAATLDRDIAVPPPSRLTSK